MYSNFRHTFYNELSFMAIRDIMKKMAEDDEH